VDVTLDPTLGREQAGRRPALVLSETLYNARTDLCVVCPVTSHAKGYPFEVPLPKGLPMPSVVLVDRIKTIDWKKRAVRFRAKCPANVMAEVEAKVRTLLGL
jgi:mRNA interferase MazF